MKLPVCSLPSTISGDAGNIFNRMLCSDEIKFKLIRVNRDVNDAKYISLLVKLKKNYVRDYKQLDKESLENTLMC